MELVGCQGVEKRSYLLSMDAYDPTDIESRELAKEAAARRAALAANAEIDDVKWLMSNKRGRRIVYRQLAAAGVWRISFNTNGLTMAFNEGQRNSGLRMMDMIIQNCPDRFTEMLKEHAEHD